MALGLVLEIANHATLPRSDVADGYRDTRLSKRGAVPGVLTTERFVNIDDANISIAVYDLSDVAVAASAAFKASGSEQDARVAAAGTSLMMFEGRQTLPGDAASPKGAAGLLVNGMSAAPEGEGAFNRWYSEEHIRALSAVPGSIVARRFVAISECPRKFLAL